MDSGNDSENYWQLEEAQKLEHTRLMDDVNYGICHGDLCSENWNIHQTSEGEFSIDAFRWGKAKNNWFYTDIGKMAHWMQGYVRDLVYAKHPKDEDQTLKLEKQLQEQFIEAYELQTQQFGWTDFRVDREKLRWNHDYEE